MVAKITITMRRPIAEHFVLPEGGICEAQRGICLARWGMFGSGQRNDTESQLLPGLAVFNHD